MTYLLNTLWLLIFLAWPLTWLLRRYAAPHIVIYGHVGEEIIKVEDDTPTASSERQIRMKKVRTKEVRFLIQNQRDLHVEGPISLQLDADPRVWISREKPRLTHGPGLIKRPAVVCDEEAGRLRVTIPEGMRPLETWELRCLLARTAPGVTLIFSAGAKGGVSHASGRVSLDLRRPVRGLSKNRLLDLGLSRTAWSYFLLVLSALSTLTLTMLLVNSSADGGFWKESRELITTVPGEVAVASVLVVIICTVTGGLVKQRPVPIIRGHNGEVWETRIGGTATELPVPCLAPASQVGREQPKANGGPSKPDT